MWPPISSEDPGSCALQQSAVADVRFLGRAAIVAGTPDFKVMARDRKIEGTNRFMTGVVRRERGMEFVTYQAMRLHRKE